MRIRQEKQLNPVSDEVLALVAVVRPILRGVLYALKQEVVAPLGGFETVPLHMLARLHRPGDGDCGICFEYAVHDAMNRKDQRVLDRVQTAVSLCKVKGTKTKSILFGAEKTGSLQLIATAKDILTTESQVLSGKQGRPAKLRSHLDSIVNAFRNRNTKTACPIL